MSFCLFVRLIRLGSGGYVTRHSTWRRLCLHADVLSLSICFYSQTLIIIIIIIMIGNLGRFSQATALSQVAFRVGQQVDVVLNYTGTDLKAI